MLPTQMSFLFLILDVDKGTVLSIDLEIDLRLWQRDLPLLGLYKQWDEVVERTRLGR